MDQLGSALERCFDSRRLLLSFSILPERKHALEYDHHEDEKVIGVPPSSSVKLPPEVGDQDDEDYAGDDDRPGENSDPRHRQATATKRGMYTVASI